MLLESITTWLTYLENNKTPSGSKEKMMKHIFLKIGFSKINSILWKIYSNQIAVYNNLDESSLNLFYKL